MLDTLFHIPRQIGGLPVFGYVSVATLLAAGVMLVPAAAARLLDAVPRPAAVTWKAALAQLRGSASQSARPSPRSARGSRPARPRPLPRRGP